MPPAAPTTDESVGIAEFGAILRRRAGWILATTALTTLLGAAYLMVAKPKYTATTAVFIDPRNRASFQIEGTGTGAGYDPNLVDSQVRLIESDTVLRRVVEIEKLDNDPEFSQGGPNAARAVMALFKEAVKVKRPERTYVVEIEVRTREAAKSARLANAIARAYLNDSLESRSDTARRESVWLETHLRELQGRLQEAENRVEAYKAEKRIVGAEGKLVNEQQLTESSRGLVDARRKALEARSILDHVTQLKKLGKLPDATNEAFKSTVLDRLRGQITEILRLDANARMTLGPLHPATIEVREQLAETRRQIIEELNRIADSARNAWQVAQANEAALEKHIDSLKLGTTATNQTLVRLRELEREVEAQKAVYDKFLRDKEQIARLSIDTPAGRVIAPAVAPIAPSSPNKILVMALAFVGGLFGGVALALSLETLARSRSMPAKSSIDPPAPLAEGREASEPKQSPPAAPVLMASLPALPRRPALRWMNRRGGPSKPDAILLDAVTFEDDTPYARALRDLAARLDALPSKTDALRLLVSGLHPGAGATTLTANLAMAYARAGRNVLVIDANGASHTLTEHLAANREAVGVSVSGRTMLALSIPVAVSTTPPRGAFYFLPPGGVGQVRGRKTPRIAGIDLILIDGPALKSPAMTALQLQDVDGLIVALPPGMAPDETLLASDLRARLVNRIARAA